MAVCVYPFPGRKEFFKSLLRSVIFSLILWLIFVDKQMGPLAGRVFGVVCVVLMDLTSYAGYLRDVEGF